MVNFVNFEYIDFHIILPIFVKFYYHVFEILYIKYYTPKAQKQTHTRSQKNSKLQSWNTNTRRTSNILSWQNDIKQPKNQTTRDTAVNIQQLTMYGFFSGKQSAMQRARRPMFFRILPGSLGACTAQKLYNSAYSFCADRNFDSLEIKYKMVCQKLNI